MHKSMIVGVRGGTTEETTIASISRGERWRPAEGGREEVRYLAPSRRKRSIPDSSTPGVVPHTSPSRTRTITRLPASTDRRFHSGRRGAKPPERNSRYDSAKRSRKQARISARRNVLPAASL